MVTSTGNRELGIFLRQRRRALRPDDVGIAVVGRRHVKGLRREEVAQLAGIGVSWYTLLEQGRVNAVTRRTLDGIAAALKLDQNEREHVMRLAGNGLAARKIDDAPRPDGVIAFVDSIPTHPSFVITARFDVVAANAAARELFFFNAMPDDWNLLRHMVLDDGQRRLFASWRDTVRNMIGLFRSNYGRVGDASFEELIDELRAASPEFGAMWNEERVELVPEHRCRILHPTLGTISMRLHSFVPVGYPFHMLISFTYEEP